ncbi:MAG TPA: YcnI family protein [Micromonosporaceae bacterium]|nr:YcnI family protein [Micromonosporaceae bacterium]
MRHKWVRRAGVVASGALIGALAFAGAAAAHVTVSPSSAQQGAFATIAFRVPTESDKASTTKVDVRLDMNNPIATVDYQALPGWTTTVTVSKLAKPITDDDGNQVTQAVSEIVWTANSAATAIKPGQFQEFPIELGPLPKTGSIAFKTLQTYSDGSVVRWIDPTPPGGPEPENPAPVLALTPAGSAASDNPSAGATGTAPTVSTAPAASGDSSSGGSSSGAMTIAIIGGLLGLVGAVLGGAAYARTRGGDDTSS